MKKQNRRLAIVTGKSPATAELSLKSFGVASYFDLVETGSLTGPIKPLSLQNICRQWGAAPEHLAYIGDAPYDMQAAREVGIIPLAAAWAASEERVLQLKEQAPFSLFERVEDLIAWIEALDAPEEK